MKVKDRWTHEEKEMFARKEAELKHEGHTFVNKLLEEAFPNRTLEAIKGQRRRASHKARVARYLESIDKETSETDGERLSEAEIAEVENPHPNATLYKYFKELEPLREPNNPLARKMNNICSLACNQQWQDLNTHLGLFIREAIPPEAKRTANG